MISHSELVNLVTPTDLAKIQLLQCISFNSETSHRQLLRATFDATTSYGIRLEFKEKCKIQLLPGFDPYLFPYLIVIDFMRISIYNINSKMELRIAAP